MEYLDFELPIKELIDQLDKTIEIGEGTKRTNMSHQMALMLKGGLCGAGGTCFQLASNY